MCFRAYLCRVLLVTALLLMAAPAYSQVNWWRTDSRSAVTFELHKLDYNTGSSRADNIGFFNAVGFVGAQLRVSPRFSLIAELPFASFDIVQPIYYQDPLDFRYGSSVDDEFAIGNPFLGFEASELGPGPVLRAGVRIPLISEEKPYAIATGVLGCLRSIRGLWSQSLDW